MQGTKTHRTLMLCPDKSKKNDMNPAMQPTITINPLQPIILRRDVCIVELED